MACRSNEKKDGKSGCAAKNELEEIFGEDHQCERKAYRDCPSHQEDGDRECMEGMLLRVPLKLYRST